MLRLLEAVALHPVREVRRRAKHVALVEVAGAVRENEVLLLSLLARARLPNDPPQAYNVLL